MVPFSLQETVIFCDKQWCGGHRFTKDTESVDTSVSYSVQSFMTCSISVLGAILVVTAVTPTIILAVAALSIVYYRVQVCVMPSMTHCCCKARLRVRACACVCVCVCVCCL